MSSWWWEERPPSRRRPSSISSAEMLLAVLVGATHPEVGREGGSGAGAESRRTCCTRNYHMLQSGAQASSCLLAFNANRMRGHQGVKKVSKNELYRDKQVVHHYFGNPRVQEVRKCVLCWDCWPMFVKNQKIQFELENEYYVYECVP